MCDTQGGLGGNVQDELLKGEPEYPSMVGLQVNQGELRIFLSAENICWLSIFLSVGNVFVG